MIAGSLDHLTDSSCSRVTGKSWRLHSQSGPTRDVRDWLIGHIPPRERAFCVTTAVAGTLARWCAGDVAVPSGRLDNRARERPYSSHPRAKPTTRQGKPVRTYSPKPGEIERQWHVIDASDVVLGRLATHAATLLRGKH